MSIKRKTMIQVYVSTRKKVKDLAKSKGKLVPAMAEEIFDIGIKNFTNSDASSNAQSETQEAGK